MNKMDAIIVDTYDNRSLLIEAIIAVSKLKNINKIIVFSHEEVKGCETIIIKKLKSIIEYNELILVRIPEFTKQEFLLIFQWDGFPLDPDEWNDDFYKYDYIGATHFSETYMAQIYNGGFSIRSYVLAKEVKSIINKYPNLLAYPEDVIISDLLREKLEKKDLKFATINDSKKFSYEHGNLPDKVFGFHGVFNFPFIMKEQRLIDLSAELIERINDKNILIRFLFNANLMKYRRLTNILINNIDGVDKFSDVKDYLDKNKILID